MKVVKSISYLSNQLDEDDPGKTENKELFVEALAFIYSLIVTVIVSGLVVNFVKTPSLISGAGILIGGGFALPVKFIYENFEDLYSSLEQKIIEEKAKLGLTSFFFVLSSLSFSQGIIFYGSGILNLSFHASAQVFLPIRTLFSTVFGVELGELLFTTARLLLNFLWFYLIIGLIVDSKDELGEYIFMSS